MKKTTILLTIITFAILNHLKATTVIIQAMGTTSANEQFSPQVANANCGDTIRWVLVSGTHTTASTSVPAGAATWTSGNITTSGFIYVVTVAGTYNYTCHPATGGHMDASIVVQCSTGIPSLSNEGHTAVFPNPTNGKLTIDIKESPKASLVVYKTTGEKVYQSQLTNTITEADLNIQNGIYFYQIESETKLIGKGKLVIQH